MMHPIQQAWARLFEELDQADAALTDGTAEDDDVICTITTEAERDQFYEDFTDAEAYIVNPECPPGTSRKITWTEDGDICVHRPAGVHDGGKTMQWSDFGKATLPITVHRERVTLRNNDD